MPPNTHLTCHCTAKENVRISRSSVTSGMLGVDPLGNRVEALWIGLAIADAIKFS